MRPPDCPSLAKNPETDNGVTIFRHDDIVQFFWRWLFLLSSLFINIITGSRIMSIFFYKGSTRNPEIRNNPVWVLPYTWRLELVMDTKIGTILSNRILLNAAKFQGYSFYRFWVIKGKPTRGGGKTTLPPTQIRVKSHAEFNRLI